MSTTQLLGSMSANSAATNCSFFCSDDYDADDENIIKPSKLLYREIFALIVADALG